MEHKISQVYDIAGYGKSKVDHVRGLAKVIPHRVLQLISFFPKREHMLM